MFKSVRGKAFPLAASAAPAEPPEVRPPLGTRPRLRLKCIIRRALVGARFARKSLRVGHVEGRETLRTLVLPVLVHPAEGASRTRLSNFRILVAPAHAIFPVSFVHSAFHALAVLPVVHSASGAIARLGLDSIRRMRLASFIEPVERLQALWTLVLSVLVQPFVTARHATLLDVWILVTACDTARYPARITTINRKRCTQAARTINRKRGIYTQA